MASEGPLYPGTVATAQEAGDDNDWSDPGNVSADDGAEATVTASSFDANDQTFALRCSNFGFAIPGGATIDGIVVEIEQREFAGSARDQQVQLFSAPGTTIGDDKATLDAWPSSATIATYGGAADDWNASPTPALVNDSGFGVQVKAFATSVNTDVGIDFVRITVHYTEGGVTGTGDITIPSPSFPLAFDSVRRSIIDGIVSAQSEGSGWNAQKANIPVTDVVRTSDTVVTITLSALGSYDISATETLTVTVPRNALVTGPEIIATPTFEIEPDAGVSGAGSLAVAPSMSGSGLVGAIGTGALAVALALSGSGAVAYTGTGSLAVAQSMSGAGSVGGLASGTLAVSVSPSGSGTLSYSGTGDVPVAVVLSGSGIAGNTGTGDLAVSPTLDGTGDAGATTGSGALAVALTLSGTSPFAAVRAAIIAGLDSAQSEASGWDAIVKAGLPVDAVVRTSDTVVTITLPAFASYSISANETITVTVPGSALTGASPIVATPTFDVTADSATGTGSLAVAVSPDGEGAVVTPNTGSLAVAVAPSGAGLAGNIGTGSLAVPQPAYAFGDKVTIPALTVSGTGTVANGIASTNGDLAVAVSPSGSGSVIHTGTGDLAVSVSMLGSSSGVNTGTGSIAVPVPTLAATGSQSHTGTVTIAAATPSLSGAGLIGNTGTGDLPVSVGLSGTGSLTATGTGTLAAACVLEGTGSVVNPVSGSGDLAMDLTFDDARGLVTARGRRGRYKDEHGAALESVANVGDFKDEHSSALIDITDAGV